MIWRLSSVLALACTALIVGCGGSEVRNSRADGPYAITELDAQGDASRALSISDDGLIVGSADYTPVAWEKGEMTVLGSTFGEARAVNTSGQVVGQSRNRAFLWEDGEMTDLGTLGERQSDARDVSDRGQIVGDLDDGERAFLWEDGELTDLGTLTVDRVWEYESCSASAINDAGHVVGNCGYVLNRGRAFLWQDGEMTDLGTLGGDASEATDVNDQGQIVGSSTTAPGQESQQAHAFLWTDGEMTDLGTLGGTFAVAFAINESGQVVGFSETASGAWHAFLWTDGKMTDLGALEPDFNSFAFDINDSGQIVGESGPGWGGTAVLWERSG